MTRLESRVAIITGGASGMGQTAARVFCREGARVVLADVNAEGGEAAAQELRAGGGDVRFIKTDLTVESEVAALVEQTVATHGRLDVLFSNAGVKNSLGAADTISEADWDWVLNTNLKATFFCVKHAAPTMISQSGGSIIVNASVAGFFAMPNQPAYNASKAAEIQFARSVAADYGRYNVRCNVICPGPIGGPFAAKFIFADAERAREAGQGVGQIVPLGRMGASEEVASVALFLASDESSYVNGATISIDGGMTLGFDVVGLAAKFGGHG
jgi:NAD(P)-dependent dehydrogenase (short-subunit alcohol dehydrogenase family)